VIELLAKTLDLLPHGPEFRFIDRLIGLEPGKSAVAEYFVKGTEPFLRGHFPDQPLFPGVLLIEAGAQLAGIVAQSDPSLAPLPGLKLAAVRAIKIAGSAKPGEMIRIEAILSGRLSNLIQAEIKALVAGGVVMEGSVTLSGEKTPASPGKEQ
jgi:3-hydroxyacyl-[acyl-carrier-protein] dehydratase